MTKFNRTLLLLFTFGGCILLIGCSSQQEKLRKADNYIYKSGFPEFRTSAFGFIDEERGPMLEVNTEVVKESLVYKQQGDSLTANFTVDIQFTALDNKTESIPSKRINRQIISKKNSIIRSQDIANITYKQQVSAGNYEVSITVGDLNSQKKLTQSKEIYIPETKSGEYTLSDIRLFGKEQSSNEWNQMSSYHIPGSIDSLRFVFQVISPQTDTAMTLDTRLVKFKSDTGLPRSITRNNYNPSSIEYKGIDFDEVTELQTNKRVLTDYGNVFLEYNFATPNRGNYRFEVRARKTNDEQFRGRSFGVKSEHFPSIVNVKELARPLYYLMDSGEYEDLIENSNIDSLKQAIDRFWLKNVGNKRKAQQVIEQYYFRVEEANKRYSNFKEGWKTDRGMIYILFGEPFTSRDRLRELQWYYSYNLENPEYRFFFEQPKLNNQYFPFDHYLLNRNNYYHNIVYNQQGLWLSGRILKRQL